MADLEREVRAGKTPWALWWSLVAGFLAWTLDLGLSYVLEQHSCSTGHYYVLHVIAIVSLGIALSGFGTGLKLPWINHGALSRLGTKKSRGSLF